MKSFLLILFSLFVLWGCSGTTEETATDQTQNEDLVESDDEVEIDDEEEEFDLDRYVNVNTLDEYNKRVVGETYNLNDNPLVAADTYTSSDESIASIDEDGMVTIHRAGYVEITSEDSSVAALPQIFSFAHAATTSLEILAKDPDFYFKSWVGEEDTQLDFNTSLFGLTFVSSDQEQCDPITLSDCGTYQQEVINTSAITDNTATLNDPGFYSFTFGENTAATSVLSAEKFEVRNGEATVVFKDRLYLIGGYTSGDVNNPREFKNDVWMSKDGDEWIEIAESAAFSPRLEHQVVVHDDKLWLIGGTNGPDIFNDVWVSEDGITWTEVSQENSFSVRSSFELFILNGDFYIAGGYADEAERLTDLWRSSDGANWSQVAGFNYADANNTPVVVDGESGSQTAFLLGDSIYSSTDGTNWTEVVESSIFAGFDNREAAIVNDEIWLFTYTFEYFGTHGSKNISRVFKSTDGETWTIIRGGIYLGNMIAREAKPIPFKDRLFIVGGRAAILEYTNEVWSTVDGELWIEHALGGFYGPRHSHAMVSHNGKLYSAGGIASDTISSATPYKADVWSSEDGLDWNLESDEHRSFRPRGGHSLLSVGDKLCYVGGYGRLVWGTASGYRYPYTGLDPDPAGPVQHVILFERYGVFGDIACSIDGGTIWSEVVPSGDDYFDEREGFASVYFNDKLWIIGGNFNSNYFSDVWSTEDVDDWEDRLDLFTYGAYYTNFTEVSNAAAFGPRTGHAVTIHNGELYLSAGKDSEGFYLDDLWKSADGENWTLVNADMGEMDKRAYHQMVSFDGKLWIIAGRANYHETLVYEDTTVYEANDIWVSEDNGITWSEVTPNAPFEQRQDFQAVVHDDAIYITGGTGGDGYVTVQGKDSILNDVWRSEDGENWRAGFYKDMTLTK